MGGERVAVVGGTGYLGSHIVRTLLDGGYDTVIAARKPEKVAKVLPGVRAEVRYADVTDLPSLYSALEGCTYVHSVAALLNQLYTGASRLEEDEIVRTNVEGTLNVLRAAHQNGAVRVILTSTCGTRYTPPGVVADECTPPGDKLVNDAYIRSKVQAELAAEHFSRESGLPVVQILAGGLIGPGDWGPGPLGVTVVERLNGINRPSIDGGFPAVDVRDVALAHVRAMEVGQPRPTYMVAGETISSRRWAELVTLHGGVPPVNRFLSARSAMFFAWIAETAARMLRKAPLFTRNQVRHLVQGQRCDSSLAERELGLVFTPIETSAREMIQWYFDNGFVTGPVPARE